MGYTTEFDGRFEITPPLTAEHKAVLDALADYPDDNPEGAPDSYCQWDVTPDGAGLQWNGGEKFYNYVEWLYFLIDAYLKPWGHVLSGSVKWQGEDVGDAGTIHVRENEIATVTREDEVTALCDVAELIKFVLQCKVCGEGAEDNDQPAVCDICRAALKKALKLAEAAA